MHSNSQADGAFLEDFVAQTKGRGGLRDDEAARILTIAAGLRLRALPSASDAVTDEEALFREIRDLVLDESYSADAVALKLSRRFTSQSEWEPCASAPRTGEHILVTALGARGFGFCGDKHQDWCAVVHYWANPGEEGFYLSSGLGGDEAPVTFTHWRPLASRRTPTGSRASSEETK